MRAAMAVAETRLIDRLPNGARLPASVAGRPIDAVPLGQATVQAELILPQRRPFQCDTGKHPSRSRP